MNNKLVIKKIQLALIAKEPIKKYHIIVKIEGKIINRPTITSLQIGEKKHIECEPIELINHSCNPNTYVDFQNLTLKALKNIKNNEELTFNYLSTEYETSHKFKCECKSRGCFGYIKGFKHLKSEERKKIKPSISPVLKKITKHR